MTLSVAKGPHGNPLASAAVLMNIEGQGPDLINIAFSLHSFAGFTGGLMLASVANKNGQPSIQYRIEGDAADPPGTPVHLIVSPDGLMVDITGAHVNYGIDDNPIKDVTQTVILTRHRSGNTPNSTQSATCSR